MTDPTPQPANGPATAAPLTAEAEQAIRLVATSAYNYHVLKVADVRSLLASLDEARKRSQPSPTDDMMTNPVKREWVNCPVCGEPDMRREEDAKGNALILCVNHACASNGGGNAAALGSDSEILTWLSRASVTDRITAVSRTSPTEEGTENNLRAVLAAMSKGGTQ